MFKLNSSQKYHIFETETWLPHPVESVFAFFKEAKNLQELTPDWLDFKILNRTPIAMREGVQIHYQLKLYGVRFRWLTEISLWQPPHKFVDTQLKGPYRRWVHTHWFESRDGGTLMHDRVEYRARGGLLEPLLDKLFVRKNIEKIFDYRTQQIKKVFKARSEEPTADALAQ